MKKTIEVKHPVFNIIVFIFTLILSSCIRPPQIPDLSKILTVQTYKDSAPRFSVHGRARHAYGESTHYIGVPTDTLSEEAIVRILLRAQDIAMVSNFTENVLLFSNPNRDIQEILSDKAIDDEAIKLTNGYLEFLSNKNYLSFGLDYLWGATKGERNFEVYSGEGFPPISPNYVFDDRYASTYIHAPKAILPFPVYSNEVPNGDFYPKSMRYIIFTSAQKRIAERYGGTVLTLSESDTRGISLPTMCEALHGSNCLTQVNNISYWKHGDFEEYVLPGYIESKEVVAAEIKYGFEKGLSRGTAIRKFKRADEDKQVSVNVFDQCDELVGEYKNEKGSVVFQPEPVKNYIPNFNNKYSSYKPIVHSQNQKSVLTGDSPQLLTFSDQISGLDYDEVDNSFWAIEDKSTIYDKNIIKIDKLGPNTKTKRLRIKIPPHSDLENKYEKIFNLNGKTSDYESIRVSPKGDLLVIAWEGRVNSLLLVDKNSMTLKDIIVIPFEGSYQSNSGIEGIDFSASGNAIYVGLEHPPALIKFTWPIDVNYYEKIELPTNIESISEVLVVADIKNDNEIILILDRNTSRIYEFNSNSHSYSCTALLLLDKDNRSYTYTSPEAMTLNGDGNIYIATDPWKQNYEPDFLDGRSIEFPYSAATPLLYTFNNWFH